MKTNTHDIGFPCWLSTLLAHWQSGLYSTKALIPLCQENITAFHKSLYKVKKFHYLLIIPVVTRSNTIASATLPPSKLHIISKSYRLEEIWIKKLKTVKILSWRYWRFLVEDKGVKGVIILSVIVCDIAL